MKRIDFIPCRIPRAVIERVMDIAGGRGMSLDDVRAGESDKARVTRRSIIRVLLQENIMPEAIAEFLNIGVAEVLTPEPMPPQIGAKVYEVQSLMQAEIKQPIRRGRP